MMKRREKEIKRILKRLEGYSKEIKAGICNDILCHIISKALVDIEINTKISNLIGYYVEPSDDIRVTVAKLDPDGSLRLAHPDNYHTLYSIDDLTPEMVIRLAFKVPQIFKILSDETLFDIKFLSDSARSLCDSLFSAEYITKMKHIEPFLAAREDKIVITAPFRGAHITEFIPLNTFVFTTKREYCHGVPRYGVRDDDIVLIAGHMVWSSTEYIVRCWNQVNGEKKRTEYKLTLGFPGLFSGYENFNKS